MSYLSDIEKVLTPEQYQALVKPMQFQAKKSYKGVPQDWQAQILLPLDTSKLTFPKQLEMNAKNKPIDLKNLSANPYTKEYQSNKAETINGIPVYAKYNKNGALIGYVGAENKKLYVNDSTSYQGSWDATGKSSATPRVAEGGGFVKSFTGGIMNDPILGAVANIVAFSYGGPEAVAALNATNTAIQGGDLADVIESGAKAGLLSYGAQELKGAIGGGPETAATIAAANTAIKGGDLGDVLESGAKAGLLAYGAQQAAGDIGVTTTPTTELTGYDAAMADLAASAPPEFAAPDLTGYDAAMADVASSATPEFTTSAPDLSTVPSQPITADQITEAIKADNIDVGGGYNPATGTGDVATATAAAETGVTNYVTADDITNTITGNADKKALYSNEGYGDTLTSEQIDAIDKAVAGGMSVKDAIDMVRAGLLINTIAGDPLDIMGGGSGTGGTSGSTGFAQVPIPAEWKSPTYAPIAGPIDLSTILSSQNMLGGTQWQNLPSQRNVTFNDIFAAGQQQTPMGSPVDLNNIVSAILGQTATSQKPA